jgi:hypothetical protein
MNPIEVIPSSTRMRAAIFMALAAIVYAILRLAGLHALFSRDAEGLSALLEIIGTLYSVVYAFATYVIWGQFAAVENEILKESGALKDLIQFSRRLKENTRDPIVRAVRNYSRAVVESEWATLSRGKDIEHTDKLFSTVIASVTEVKPEDDGERSVHERLLEIASQASSHRQERLAVSAKRMPQTLLLFVKLTAFAILFLLLLYPFSSLIFGIIAMVLTTMLLFLAHFVLTDLDNPFEGTWNVKSDSFSELATKYR